MVASRIRAWRLSRAASRAQIAKACDVTVAAVGAWERGEAEPSFRSLVRLVDALGLSMSEFFGRLPTIGGKS